MVNKYGLSRHIPEDVKREVRRRCAFGCAICGATVTEYEHFAPDFTEAKSHSPDGIILLCPSHHRQVTKRIIPKGQLHQAYGSPAAKTQGFSREHHPHFRGRPSVKLGGSITISGTSVPLRIGDENVFEFRQPEPGSNVSRISLKLRDSRGKAFLSVDDNEWKVLAGDWDFESCGPRYIFRDSSGGAFLTLKFEAPGRIIIEKLKTVASGVEILASDDHMTIGGMMFRDLSIYNVDYGIVMPLRGPDVPYELPPIRAE